MLENHTTKCIDKNVACEDLITLTICAVWEAQDEREENECVFASVLFIRFQFKLQISDNKKKITIVHRFWLKSRGSFFYMRRVLWRSIPDRFN